MKRINLLIFIFALALSITGCASMFSSKIKNIPVNTTPENATISLYSISGGKIYEAKSPCVISLNKKDIVDGKVIISQKGYKDVQVNLGRTIEVWGIANGCFFILPGFIIGGGIDFLNGNLVKPEVETINIILEPETNQSEVTLLDSETILNSKNISINIKKNGSEYLLFMTD